MEEKGRLQTHEIMWKRGHQQPFVAGGGTTDGGTPGGTAAAAAITVAAESMPCGQAGWPPRQASGPNGTAGHGHREHWRPLEPLHGWLLQKNVQVFISAVRLYRYGILVQLRYSRAAAIRVDYYYRSSTSHLRVPFQY